MNRSNASRAETNEFKPRIIDVLKKRSSKKRRNKRSRSTSKSAKSVMSENS